MILLLLGVGMEMDLGELGAVGRAVDVGRGRRRRRADGRRASSWRPRSVTAATSRCSSAPRSRRRASGITARVFSDLRALATVEARTVLGAAVADDVLGLVILTVVVRLVSEGSVSIADVARDRGRWRSGSSWSTAVAGLEARARVLPVPRPARRVGRARSSRSRSRSRSRSPSSPTPRSSRPIVGAFVAGLALSGELGQRSASSASSRRSATSSSRCSSSRSASRRRSRSSSTPRCSGSRRPARGRDRRQARRRRSGAFGVARRQAADRHRHDPPRRGRADLRHHRAPRGHPRRQPLRRAPARRARRPRS